MRVLAYRAFMQTRKIVRTNMAKAPTVHGQAWVATGIPTQSARGLALFTVSLQRSIRA